MPHKPETPPAEILRHQPDESLTLEPVAVTALYGAINEQAATLSKRHGYRVLDPDAANLDEVFSLADLYTSTPKNADVRDPNDAAIAVGSIMDYCRNKKVAVTPKKLQSIIKVIASELVYIDSLETGVNRLEEPRPNLVQQFTENLRKRLVPERYLHISSRSDIEALLGFYANFLLARQREEDTPRVDAARDFLLGRQNVAELEGAELRKLRRLTSERIPEDLATMFNTVGVAIDLGESLETPEQVRSTTFVRDICRKILSNTRVEIDGIGTDVLLRFVGELTGSYIDMNLVVMREGNLNRMRQSLEAQQTVVRGLADGGRRDDVMRVAAQQTREKLTEENLRGRFSDFYLKHMNVDAMIEVLEYAQAETQASPAEVVDPKWPTGDLVMDSIQSRGFVVQAYLRSLFKNMRKQGFNPDNDLSAHLLKPYYIIAQKLIKAAEAMGLEWQDGEAPWEFINRLPDDAIQYLAGSSAAQGGARKARSRSSKKPKTPAPSSSESSDVLDPAQNEFEMPSRPDAPRGSDALKYWEVLAIFRQRDNTETGAGLVRVQNSYNLDNTAAQRLVLEAMRHFGILLEDTDK
ncbi:hypothetical protein JNM87_04630 [Candidatus Saccharibacteria bacterium]|nr:hypothetical protein [Candidatus Saccharibacteria bacterium]